MKKRLLALLMVLALLVTCIPTGVVAEGTEDVVIDNVEQITQPQTEEQAETIVEEATEASKRPVKNTSSEKHDHSAQQHDCPHCEEEVTWTELRNGDALPIDGGHYVLMENMEVTAQARIIGSAEVVICLNGYTIDGTGGNKSVFRVDDTAKLFLDDCAATLDEDGMLVSGGGIINSTNASGTTPGAAIYATEQAQVTLRNVKFVNNDDSAAGAQYYGGGAVHVRHDVILNVSGCLFQENKSCDGGAIGTRGYTQVTISNTIFKDNEATNSGGAINFTNRTTTGETNASVTKKAATIRVEDCVFTGNEAANRAGAFYVDGTNATVIGGEMTGNKAKDGGAMHCYRGDTVLDGVSITGNENTNNGGSAIYVNGGDAKLKLKDCTITGNKSTGSKLTYRGGVYMTNQSDMLTVSGATVIDDNMIGVVDGVGGQECNIVLQNAGATMQVDGLTEGAKMSVLVDCDGEVAELTEPSFLIDVNDPTQWNKLWVIYEVNGKAVDYDKTGDKFFFTSTSTHIHCACGAHLYADETCEHAVQAGCDHSEITYEPWGDDESEKGKLPNASGNYYLVDNITVSKETAVSTGDVINLCLNGKTIKVDNAEEGKINDQIFYMTRTANLTISDCQASYAEDGTYSAGKLTGGTYAAISMNTYENKTHEVKLTIFDGMITGNSNQGSGGAINMKEGTGVLNIHGGEISNNTANKYLNSEGAVAGGNGGAIYVGNGNTVTVTGGQIFGNHADRNAGAISLNGANTTMTMTGGQISDNTAGGAAGGVLMQNKASLNLQGGQVIGNESKTDGGGVYVSTNSSMTMSGGAVTNNTTTSNGGGISVQGGAFTMTGGEVSNNTANNGAGLHIRLGERKNEENETVRDVPVTVDIQGGSITGNTATSTGGGIFLQGKGAVLTMEGGRIAENTAVSGAGVLMQTSAAMKMTDGQISGNKAQNGAGIYASYTTTFTMEGGQINANTADNGGGGIYVLGATAALTGGQLSGNTAKNGAGMYLYAFTRAATETTPAVTYIAEVLLAGVNISGNDGHGVYARANATDVTVDGDTVITDNTAGNLYLCGDTTVTIGTLGENAKVGLSADLGVLPRLVSANEASLTGLVSDNLKRPLELIDDHVYISFNKNHIHCDHGDASGCGHTEAAWVEWEDPTSLPSGSGYYYLKVNVILTDAVKQATGDLHLCLNGHTVTAGGEEGTKTDRIYSVSGDAKLSISDCTAHTDANGNYVAGQLTGASNSAIFVPNQPGKNEDDTNKVNTCVINLYDGILTGNSTEGYGGVMSIQDGAVFNMYGGEISGNTVKIATDSEGKTSGGHGSALYVGTDATFNMHGGVITGNTAENSAAVYVCDRSTMNVYGGAINGNTAAKNAGGVLLSGAATTMTMTGGEITGNTAANAAGGVLVQSRATLKLQGGTISGNTAGVDGGGVYVSTNSVMIMTGGEIIDNTAKNYGAGVNVLGGGFTMEGGSISGNSCANGAGVAVRLGERTVEGKTVKDVPATVTLKGGSITGNTATSTGGGVFLQGKGAVLTMEGGEIAENTAVSGAGVLMQTAAAMKMTDGQISGNKAQNGAGIYASYTTTFTMEGGQIKANAATAGGGGLYVLGSTVQLTGGKITENTAKNGAGIYTNSYTKEATETTKQVVYTAQLKLADMTVSGNQAENLGGGIYVRANTAKLTLEGDTVITDNTAGNRVNNLFLGGDTTMTIGTMGDKANVGISADISKLPRQVSDNKAALKGLVSDNKYRPLVLIEEHVYIGFTTDHIHCDCGDSDVNCDHTDHVWAAWDDPTSLPTGDGYYYLITDVTLKQYTRLDAGDLHLCLNGHTVTADGEEGTSSDRVFYVNKEAKLTISDCTASYAEDGTYKAGKLTGGTSGVVFVPNLTGKNEDGTNRENRSVINLYDGILTGNTGANGGAVSVQDGAVFNMYGGEISGNTAHTVAEADDKVSGGHGSALYVGSNATFNLYGGTICDNTAEAGAAIYVSGSTFNMAGGKIAKNKTLTTAAGVLLTGSKTVMTMTGGEISGHELENAAGAVLMQTKATFNMKGGKITGNKATSGAGVYVSYTTTFNMEGGEISGNEANNGAGVYVLGSVVNLSGGKIAKNHATSGGAGVYSTNFVRKATETREEQIYTAQVNLSGVTVSANTADKNGAGVCASKESEVNLTAGTISGNVATNAAGGVLLQSGSKLNLKGGSVTGNSAKSGGGVYISTNSFITMTGGSVSYNTSSGSSGGMYLLRCQATLSGGSITGNTAKTNGAGVYMSGATVTLSGTNITDNVAEGNGGGICTTRAKVTKDGVTNEYYTSLTMYGGTVSGNSATNGGGILLQNKTTMTLKDGLIENNKTTKGGAGIYVSTNCTFTMEGGTVQCNEAEGTGAGIYHYKSTGTYTGGLIKGNKAVGAGGGLMVNGTECVVTIKDLTITENTAKNGGGLVAQGKGTVNIEGGSYTKNVSENNGGFAYISTNSFSNITGGTFAENKCTKRGGAFYLEVTSTNTIVNALITGNSADEGGGIFTRSNLTISDTEISNNTAATNGGGINTFKMGARMYLQPDGLIAKNLTVTGNTAGGQGGGMYLGVGHKIDLRSSTITGNTSGAEGGGIWAIFDTNLHDLTVTGNTSGGEGYALYLAACEYDGESYVKGVFKISGVMQVKDNNGGDMFIGEQTTVSVAKEGLSEGTLMNIKLHSGYLTQTLYGAYDYEGGNLEYVVTAGDRSLTEPEYDAAYNDQFKPEEPTEEPAGEGTEDQTKKSGISPVVWIAGGAGAVVIAAVIAIIAALGKKKKSAAGK